jgi:hypothetical protein
VSSVTPCGIVPKGITPNPGEPFPLWQKKGRAISDPAFALLQLNIDLFLELPPESPKVILKANGVTSEV